MTGRSRRSLDLTDRVGDAAFRRRFWSKVDATGDCWIWTRSLHSGGYGQFVIRKPEMRLAHVVSYALTKGPVPAGMSVCHTCDNPPCVRPDHLFLGTQSDNAKDMFAKGRQGSRHPGTERANARLTEQDVIAIRAVPYYHGRTTDLARRYGVSQTTMRKIFTRAKWGHVA